MRSLGKLKLPGWLLLAVQSGMAQITPHPWVAIGPTGDYGSTVQPFVNGRVRSIQISPNGNDYFLYVGGSSGGIWRAQGNNGPVWTSLGENLPTPAVGSFAVRPGNQNDIIVGTGDFARYIGTGFYRTTDAGATWSNVLLPTLPRYCFQILYPSSDPNVIVAATERGLLRSTTGPDGDWSITLTGNVTDVIVDPSNSNVLYSCRATGSGISGGVYRTIDGGVTWANMTLGYIPFDSCGIAHVAVCRTSPNVVACVYEWEGVIKGVWKSMDGGSSWTDITGMLLNLGNGQASHALSIAIQPDNANTIYVGANEWWRSTTGGASWEPHDPNKPIYRHQDITRLYFHPATGDSILWICNDAGIYRYRVGSAAGASWNGNSTSGLQLAQITDMGALREFRAIGLQDDGAAATATTTGTLEGYACCDAYHVSITDAIGKVFWYTLDGRVTKQVLGGGETDVSDPGNSMSRLWYDRRTDKVYSLIGGSLLSRPATATGPAPWTSEVSFALNIGNLSGNPLTGQTMIVWSYLRGYITFLHNNGSGWVLRDSKLIGISGSDTLDVLCVYPSPYRNGEYWAGIATYWGTEALTGKARVVHTIDDWQTWETSSLLPAPATQIAGIAASPFNPKQLFVATNMGAYATSDGGATWQQFMTGMPTVFCTGILYLIDHTFNGNDKLVVSTFGRGVYERLIPRSATMFVDPTWTGSEDGTYEKPFNTLVEGSTTIPDYGVVGLRAGYHAVTAPLAKPMTLRSFDGVVTIGR